MPLQQSSVKRRPAPKRPKSSSSGKRKKTSRKKKPQKNLLRDFSLFCLEGLGLTIMVIAFIILLLGYVSNRFSGTDFIHSLLPFAGGIFAIVVLVSILLSVWKRVRRWLQGRSQYLPVSIVLGLTLMVCGFIPHQYFTRAFGYYRTLVGGKEEAGRVVLAHQVYAAYRRLDTAPLEKMIARAEPFSTAIDAAAAAYELDPDLLKGLAATESSYLPRKSADGGHGLFQITRVPTSVTEEISKRFPTKSRDLSEPRYNAFLGAATLRYYLAEMNDDLFLGLLAYNIGPANGGLRFIMQKYGVTDFTTIQPYLLQLPRHYPTRVLSYALAFRIYRKEGRLLPYAEGKNALSIQALGIPGL
ncbi:transglycosylase SLT domain-containing protein [Desulforhopalus sp. IMCC35007]|uniref:transglycosylase SLT domain-containing protein n=1 Tax=Desulforhopalus sp. IMCC35007 TaxID=2569543 RepID=UPI00197AAF2C|nr:transglycosylase SLT domain-containing protein [Desulforhopalus sp. IMCC35007]